MRKFLPFIIWTLVIFGLCSMPGKAIPKINWLELLSFDKFVHASIFFIEEILFIHALLSLTEQNSFRKNYKVISIFTCIAYGGILELMQYYIFSERSGDVLDFIANSTGVIAGLFSCQKIVKISNEFRNKFRAIRNY